MDKKFRAAYLPDIELGHGKLEHGLMFYQRVIDGNLFFVAEADEDVRYPFEVPFLDEDWIVMQYTGLKDKNGLTDIYEGDIIDTNGLVKGNIYESQNSQIHESEHVHGSTTDIVVKGMGTISWRSTEQAMLERGCNYAE